MIRRVHLVITAGGPSLFYRLLLPLRYLNPMRYQVTWMCPDLKDLRPGDIIIGQNVEDSEFWASVCALPDVLAVYDLDLAPRVQLTVGQASAAMRANLVTTSTTAWGDTFSGTNTQTVAIPSCLSPDWIGSITFRPYDHFIVGWAGPALNALDWQGLGLKLKTFARREPRARFRALGHDPFTPHVSASRRPWQENSDARWADLEFDVGLVPLASTPQNQLHSWVQVAEYSAKGIVPVASAVGQATEWIDHGVNGFLVESPEQWVEFLLKLSDDRFREKVSCAAMSRAEEWTVDKMIFMWESAYERGS